MADRGQRSMHLVSGLVSGADWRPTIFTEAVLPHHVCSLCRVVPKITFVLPCSHVLCESCRNHSVRDGSCLCPFDEEPFAEDECQRIELPEKAVNGFKAFCWNESQGCSFVGSLTAVFRHYERECAFHAVSCLRCSASILHRNLPTHYRAGCTIQPAKPVICRRTSHQDDQFPLHDIRAALEEIRRELSGPYQDLLPSLQTKMNELLEETRNHRTRTEEFAGVLRNVELSLEDVRTQGTRELPRTLTEASQSQLGALNAQLRPGADQGVWIDDDHHDDYDGDDNYNRDDHYHDEDSDGYYDRDYHDPDYDFDDYYNQDYDDM